MYVRTEKYKRQRSFKRPLVVALVASVLTYMCLFVGLLHPSTAFAHGYVIGSDPVDGSTVSTVPTMVRIFFNASISPLSVAHVYSVQSGRLVEVSAVHSFLSHTNSRELDTLIVTPNQQPLGGYEVMWTALANDDGHTTYGIIGFNVGHSSTGLEGEPTLGPSSSNNMNGVHSLNFIAILAIVWEWFVLLALTFWVGILVTERFILAKMEHASPLLVERAKKRARSLQWFCLAVLLVGEIVALLLRTTRFTDALYGSVNLLTTFQLITSTNYGFFWLARLVLISIALALLWRSSRSQTVLPLLLAGLILLTYAFAAQVIQPHISAIVLDWLYLTAQCIWFGSFAYLGYVLLPLLPTAEPDSNAATLAAFLRRLTPFVLSSIGVLVVSGLFLGEATSTQSPLTDPYGRSLLVQILLIAVMLLLSGYTLFGIRPKLLRTPVLERTLKQLGNTQAILGAAVLLCAALLSFYAPPIVFPAVTYSNPSTSASGNMQTQQAGDLAVTFAVLPGRVHYVNTVIMTITDSGGKPVTDAQVRLSTNMVVMNMGTAQATVRGGNPSYITMLKFSMAGLWDVAVTIERPGHASVPMVFQVMLKD